MVETETGFVWEVRLSDSQSCQKKLLTIDIFEKGSMERESVGYISSPDGYVQSSHIVNWPLAIQNHGGMLVSKTGTWPDPR